MSASGPLALLGQREMFVTEQVGRLRSSHALPVYDFTIGCITMLPMKAVAITAHGGVECLEIQDVPRPPQPTADRVLVRVRAAALNRADLLQRRGHYPPPPGFSEAIPGLEFSGEVAEIGAEVRDWQVGRRVFGITGGGAQAEYTVVPSNTLAEIPANLDWAE